MLGGFGFCLWLDLTCLGFGIRLLDCVGRVVDLCVVCCVGVVRFDWVCIWLVWVVFVDVVWGLVGCWCW